MVKQTPYWYSTDVIDNILLQTGEKRWAENIIEPGKGNDFNDDQGQQEYH